MTVVSEKTIRAIERAAAKRASGKPYQAGTPDEPLDPLPGWVAFQRWNTAQPAFKPVFVLTSGEPTVAEADSGWDVVERPFRVDMTVWRSGKPFRQDIPVFLNAEQGDIEEVWQALRSLWRPGDGSHPTVLRVTGPVSRANVPWVIETIDVDPGSVRRTGRRLVRVAATLGMLQFVDPAAPQLSKAGGGKLALSDKPNFTISKPGDTPRVIAKRRPPDGLGDGRKWTEIRRLNPAYRTANQRIPPGTRVRLPNG